MQRSFGTPYINVTYAEQGCSTWLPGKGIYIDVPQQTVIPKQRILKDAWGPSLSCIANTKFVAGVPSALLHEQD